MLLGEKLFTLLGALSLAAATLSTLHAENQNSTDSERCVGIVRECFNNKTLERSGCLYSAATHPFCDNSELGKLVYKRWSMSPPQESEIASPPALLGPQFVDQECLNGVDKRWASELDKPVIDSETIRALTSLLDGCKREILLDLGRS